jgi:hypothetical protein
LEKEREKTIESIRTDVIRSMVLRIKENLKEQSSSQPTNDIYFPVYNYGSSEPNRLSIPHELLHMINPDIQKLTTKV